MSCQGTTFLLGGPALVSIGDPLDPQGESGLRDLLTGEYLDGDDATAAVTAVRDASGLPVPGVSVPIALAYVAGSRGVFAGSVPAAAFGTLGALREVVISATAGSSTQIFYLAGIISKEVS